MKNVLRNTKKGILMVALLATVTGFANDADGLIVRNSKTALVLENVKVGNLLSIKDAYGIILYKESIQTAGLYTKGFDLSKLPDGEYVFELEKDLEINTIPFKVLLSKVSFDAKDESTYFKPYIKKEKDMLYVSKLNPTLEETTVNIFALSDNGDSKLSFSEKLDNSQVIEKVFKLEKGNYRIEVNSGNKEYTTYINN